MSSASDVTLKPPLVRFFHALSGVLAQHSAGQLPPLLRLERGAALVREARLEHLVGLVGTLLGVAVPRLARPAVKAAGATVRPKLRLAMGYGGAGLLVQLRYFGEAPSDACMQAAFPRACPVPPLCGPLGGARPNVGLRLTAGEVCLRVIAPAMARSVPVVRVLAGRRTVAVPMVSVARALPVDGAGDTVPGTRSLALCIGEEAVAGAAARPVVLVLRGAPVAVRVEALLGHGTCRVLPVGPLLGTLPWLLGVLDDEADGTGSPILVVDPLALADQGREKGATE